MKKVIFFAAMALVSLGFIACDGKKNLDPTLNEAEFINKKVYNQPFATACATLEKNGYVASKEETHKVPSKMKLSAIAQGASNQAANYKKTMADNDIVWVYISTYNAEVVNIYYIEFIKEKTAFDVEACNKAAKALFTHANNLAVKDYIFDGYTYIDGKNAYYNSKPEWDEWELENMRVIQEELADLIKNKEAYIQEMGEEEYNMYIAELEEELGYYNPKKEADFVQALTTIYKEEIGADASFDPSDGDKQGKSIYFGYEASVAESYVVHGIGVSPVIYRIE